jgi:hypothetical protein
MCSKINYVNRDRIEEMTDMPFVVFSDPSFDSAIVGIIEGEDDCIRVVYDYDKMVESLTLEFSESEDPLADAIEWIEFNTVRSIPYMGANAPVIMYGLG